MTVSEEVLRRLARETGQTLGQLGVLPEDEKWIRTQAETIRSLTGGSPRQSVFARIYRLARRAARTAR